MGAGGGVEELGGWECGGGCEEEVGRCCEGGGDGGCGDRLRF